MATFLDLPHMGRELSSLIQSNSFCFSLVFLFLIFLSRKLVKGGNGKLKSPPSPPKLPIIGNLHQLGKLPHRSLRSLSKKYGPIMLLHLGQTPTLVISSAETAREMMKTHDIVFSNRPRSTAANIFLYGCLDLGFSPYGEYWRQVRKIGVVEFFSLRRVQSFQFIREEEVAVLFDKIRSACLTRSSVNLSDMLLVVANNIVSRCVLSQKALEEGQTTKLGEVMRRIMVQFTEFSFQDTIPFLGWMDYISGFITRLKSTSREMDAFLDRVIDEEYRNFKSDDGQFSKKTFAQILIQLQNNGMPDIQLSRNNVKAILMDMLVGGTETTKTLMEWMMTEVVKNDKVMRKVQAEIRRIVGKKPKVEASDVEQMNYLKCIIKETLRLHTPTPLLLPRETSAGIEFGGYYIPPKTTVNVNAFAIQTDPKNWDRPEDFFPDRFENIDQIDYNGKDFQYIPFGGGRRVCPGISFGITSAEFVMANLLCWFDWKLPDGQAPENLDMNEDYGMTVCKKNPLHVVPVLYST